MNKKTKQIILSSLLVIIWMLIIFNFSNMNTIKSNGTSKGIIYKVVDITIETGNRVGLIKEIPSEKEKQIITNKLNLPLRKFMHFAIYMILSIFILKTLKYANIKNKYFITILICFVYALTDEYHQTFISGRTGQFIDVLIDTLGASIGTIIYNKLRQKSTKRNKNDRD